MGLPRLADGQTVLSCQHKTDFSASSVLARTSVE
jgi:hypothetical protein